MQFRHRRYSPDSKRKKLCIAFFVSGETPLFLFKGMKKNIFTAKKLALCAMTCTLAYVISLLEIPVFAHIGLKLDFSFCIMLIGGYLLGPIYAEIIVLVVSMLGCIASQSLGIGQLANFLLANTFVVLPVLLYKKFTGLKNVILTLVCCSLLTMGVALLCNRFIFFPLYEAFLKMSASEAFRASWHLILIFNATKCLLNSAITLLLYKRLKNILHFFME